MKNTKNWKNNLDKFMRNTFSYMHNNIQVMNSSKLFAGLMIITLNIASKFVTIKLSKTMESYLKFTFSKQILIFAMAWMGTRDIYIAFAITVVFSICMDYLFHEDSAFCCLPEGFKAHHIQLLDNDKVSEEEIRKAKEVLEKAENQKNKLAVAEPNGSNLSLEQPTQRQQQILY